MPDIALADLTIAEKPKRNCQATHTQRGWCAQSAPNLSEVFHLGQAGGKVVYSID